MFDRLTGQARQVVVQAQARERRAKTIRTEHLLLALFAVPDTLGVTVLTGHGISRTDIEADVDRLRGRCVSDAEAHDILEGRGVRLGPTRIEVDELVRGRAAS